MLSRLGSPLRSEKHGRRQKLPMRPVNSHLYEQESLMSSGNCARSWLRRRVVAIARQQRKAGPAHADLNRVVFDGAVGLLRRVGERVLIARLFADPLVEVFQL